MVCSMVGSQMNTQYQMFQDRIMTDAARKGYVIMVQRMLTMDGIPRCRTIMFYCNNANKHDVCIPPIPLVMN